MQTLHLVREVRRLGHRVVVCCYHEHDDAIVQDFREAGAEVRLLSWNRPANLLDMAYFVRNLASVFRSLRPQIIHVQYLTPGFLAVLAAKISGCNNLLVSVHYPSTMVNRFQRLLFRLAALLASVTISNSMATERSWFGSATLLDPEQDLPRVRHGTIYNCVDVEHIADRSAVYRTHGDGEALRKGGRLVLTAIGRLSPEKGLSILLEALHIVLRRNSEIILFIVGDGFLRKELEHKALVLGLHENIRWAGTCTPAEVLKYLAVTDIVIVPSLFEGFGLVAAEAMAAGVPVIATSTGGLPEVVQNGKTGILVPPSNAAVLAEAIESLQHDKARRESMGEAALVFVSKTFSIDRYDRAIAWMYRRFSNQQPETMR
jgi:L-malate glycosyltransferase